MVYDLVIVGAGPGGLSAGLRAKELGLDYLILERGKICNLFQEGYPKGKAVSDFPKEEKTKGSLWFEEVPVEELLERWLETAAELEIREGEEVTRIEKRGTFLVTTAAATYEAKKVVMAVGKEGKPRRLGVKGEEQEKVFYQLKDASAFCENKIMVVGGGDSAIDIALMLCKNNEVVISYRKEAFFRLNEKNLCQVNERCACGKVKIIFNSTLKEITESGVVLAINEKEEILENDAVFILAGSEQPVDFFRKILGVKIEESKLVLNEHFQTTLPGLFVIGDAAGKPPYLIKPAIKQGYEVVGFLANV